MKNFLKPLFFAAFGLLIATEGMAQWTTNPVSATTTATLHPLNVADRVAIGVNSVGPPLSNNRLRVAAGNVQLDATANTATTGNLYFGGITNTGTTTSGAAANGMRLSYHNTNLNGYMDVRTTTASSAFGLLFRVDNANGGTERMRICSNGNIGMGATGPLSFLSIGGNGNALWKTYINNTNTTTGSAGLRVESSATSGSNNTYSIYSTVPSGGGFTFGVYGNSTGGTGSAGRAYGVYGRGGGGTSGFNYGVFGELFNTPSNNGAGVLGYDPTTGAGWQGNTNDKWAGYFAGNAAVTKKLTVDESNSNTGVIGLNFGGTGSGASGEGIGSKRDAGGNQNGLDFYTSFTNRMHIKNDGKVVIGDLATLTTVSIGANNAQANNYLLFVRKGIMTEQLFVSTYTPGGTGVPNWPDYVFEKDYELLPLEKVDAFIQENGHLPNVPSAKEIDEQGGFELKEMALKHQEKIEEIYLHLIEMNKKVEALEAENAALKQAVKTSDK